MKPAKPFGIRIIANENHNRVRRVNESNHELIEIESRTIPIGVLKKVAGLAALQRLLLFQLRDDNL